MPGGSGLWAGILTVVGDGSLGSLSLGCPPSSAGPRQAPPFPQGPLQDTGTGLVLGFAQLGQERQGLLAN